MSPITGGRLLALVPGLSTPTANLHAQALEAARAAADLSTPLRLAHFMAQVLTETGGLGRLTESLRYRDPARLDALFSAVRGEEDARALIAAGEAAIANRVYAGPRLGNGDEASGDGWRYRGRGYLQITGRANYRRIGALVGMDLEGQPELLAAPASAAQASARYWAAAAINPHADADDLEAVTRAINPALAGLEQRRDWLARTRLVFR